MLDNLAYHLDEPDLLTEYVKAYEAERKRLTADTGRKRGQLEKCIGDIDAEIDRLVDFIAKGTTRADVFGRKIDELSSERAGLALELQGCD